MLKQPSATWLHLQPHPFRLLLYLEWILLGLSAFKAVGFPLWKHPVLGGETNYFVMASLILAFGLMGLRLPITRVGKWIYTSIALSLLAMLGLNQGWDNVLSPLLLVMLIRSCLIFQRRGRWMMASLLWLVYPLAITPILLGVWLISFPGLLRLFLQDEPIPGVTYLPNGGARLNYEFSKEQVQNFLSLVQDSCLHYITDSFLSFGLIVVFVSLSVTSLMNERAGRRKLAEAHEQLYQYSVQIEDQATLQERTRIAREIHDSLGHLLTTQNVLLQNAALSLQSDPTEAKSFLDQSRQICSSALTELRQSIALLRSDPLQGQSLLEAIIALTQDFDRSTGIQPEVTSSVQILLPDRIQVAVYRIVEEALTNIQKYSEATQVKIHLQHAPTAKSFDLSVQIEDNGKGFQIEQNATGFGLRGMQERAESLGGILQIVTQPGAGCKVCAVFPLPEGLL
ncbi:sensor histidine kinase [Leptolyngbya sp. NIES-2104]|uniref:sensor histidine kinase n=1 Tax=Leptolyngbya sp. NIES-2104 TaxID=1552121 RepID=UPI0006EC92CD|nr:sensor histidine kinase [Leptolyngbya sp. NIES-2104]GAP94289.1 signal transduction histidine kinase [Leptolyngbya sp. NIES-2104]